MRVAVVAPVWFAVPPTGYGGIEIVVSLLADGYVDAGHDVTMFASGGSRTKGKLVTPMPEPPHPRDLGNPYWLTYTLWIVGLAWSKAMRPRRQRMSLSSDSWV